MATYSSILALRILWTEEPGGLQSMGSQRVRHDWSNLAHILIYYSTLYHIQYTIHSHTTPYTHTTVEKKIAITTNHNVDESHTCNVEGKKPDSKESFRRVQCRLSSNTGKLCDGNQKNSCLWKLGIVWKGWEEPLGWWKYSIAWVVWWLCGGYTHFDKVLIKVFFLYCMFYSNKKKEEAKILI